MSFPGPTKETATAIAFGSVHEGTGWWKFTVTEYSNYIVVGGGVVELWEDGDLYEEGVEVIWSDYAYALNPYETYWVYAEGGMSVSPMVLEWGPWLDPPTPSAWSSYATIGAAAHWERYKPNSYDGRIEFRAEASMSAYDMRSQPGWVDVMWQPFHDAGIWGREFRLAAAAEQTRAASTTYAPDHQPYTTTDPYHTPHDPTVFPYESDAVTNVFYTGGALDSGANVEQHLNSWAEHDDIAAFTPAIVRHYMGTWRMRGWQSCGGVGSVTFLRNQTFWRPDYDNMPPDVEDFDLESWNPPLLDAEMRIGWTVSGGGSGMSGSHELLHLGATYAGLTTERPYDPSGTVLASVAFTDDVRDQQGSYPQHTGLTDVMNAWDKVDHDTGVMSVQTRTSVVGTGSEVPTSSPGFKVAAIIWSPQIRYLVQNPRYRYRYAVPVLPLVMTGEPGDVRRAFS